MKWICSERLQRISSNLSQTFTWTQSWTDLDFCGQRSKSLWPHILRNIIYQECPEEISLHQGTAFCVDSRINWLELEGQRSNSLTRHVCGHNSTSYSVVWKQFQKKISSWIKWGSDDILYPKGWRSTSLLHHIVLQTPWGCDSGYYWCNGSYALKTKTSNTASNALNRFFLN